MSASLANPRQEARRERLIEAAQAVFAREGLRGASMERIAAEAGVARATAYAYFTDKEDAFLQVSHRLAEQLVEAVHGALAAAGSVECRVAAALQAKHGLAFQAARQSPYAADLFAAKDRLAGPVFAAADERIVHALGAALAELRIAEPARAAAVLLAASKGVAHAQADLATLSADLALLCGAMLRGLPAG